uniref:Uncharacterized protein n=1 Tax=viral metagenome TaxID=1070528 RepID=A0A6M3JMR4_9ZZZZ
MSLEQETLTDYLYMMFRTSDQLLCYLDVNKMATDLRVDADELRTRLDVFVKCGKISKLDADYHWFLNLTPFTPD